MKKITNKKKILIGFVGLTLGITLIASMTLAVPKITNKWNNEHTNVGSFEQLYSTGLNMAELNKLYTPLNSYDSINFNKQKDKQDELIKQLDQIAQLNNDTSNANINKNWTRNLVTKQFVRYKFVASGNYVNLNLTSEQVLKTWMLIFENFYHDDLVKLLSGNYDGLNNINLLFSKSSMTNLIDLMEANNIITKEVSDKYKDPKSDYFDQLYIYFVKAPLFVANFNFMINWFKTMYTEIVEDIKTNRMNYFDNTKTTLDVYLKNLINQITSWIYQITIKNVLNLNNIKQTLRQQENSNFIIESISNNHEMIDKMFYEKWFTKEKLNHLIPSLKLEYDNLVKQSNNYYEKPLSVINHDFNLQSFSIGQNRYLGTKVVSEQIIDTKTFDQLNKDYINEQNKGKIKEYHTFDFHTFYTKYIIGKKKINFTYDLQLKMFTNEDKTLQVSFNNDNVDLFKKHDTQIDLMFYNGFNINKNSNDKNLDYTRVHDLDFVSDWVSEKEPNSQNYLLKQNLGKVIINSINKDYKDYFVNDQEWFYTKNSDQLNQGRYYFDYTNSQVSNKPNIIKGLTLKNYTKDFYDYNPGDNFDINWKLKIYQVDNEYSIMVCRNPLWKPNDDQDIRKVFDMKNNKNNWIYNYQDDKMINLLKKDNQEVAKDKIIYKLVKNQDLNNLVKKQLEKTRDENVKTDLLKMWTNKGKKDIDNSSFDYSGTIFKKLRNISFDKYFINANNFSINLLVDKVDNHIIYNELAKSPTLFVNYNLDHSNEQYKKDVQLGNFIPYQVYLKLLQINNLKNNQETKFSSNIDLLNNEEQKFLLDYNVETKKQIKTYIPKHYYIPNDFSQYTLVKWSHNESIADIYQWFEQHSSLIFNDKGSDDVKYRPFVISRDQLVKSDNEYINGVLMYTFKYFDEQNREVFKMYSTSDLLNSVGYEYFYINPPYRDNNNNNISQNTLGNNEKNEIISTNKNLLLRYNENTNQYEKYYVQRVFGLDQKNISIDSSFIINPYTKTENYSDLNFSYYLQTFYKIKSLIDKENHFDPKYRNATIAERYHLFVDEIDKIDQMITNQVDSYSIVNEIKKLSDYRSYLMDKSWNDLVNFNIQYWNADNQLNWNEFNWSPQWSNDKKRWEWANQKDNYINNILHRNLYHWGLNGIESFNTSQDHYLSFFQDFNYVNGNDKNFQKTLWSNTGVLSDQNNINFLVKYQNWMRDYTGNQYYAKPFDKEKLGDIEVHKNWLGREREKTEQLLKSVVNNDQFYIADFKKAGINMTYGITTLNDLLFSLRNLIKTVNSNNPRYVNYGNQLFIMKTNKLLPNYFVKWTQLMRYLSDKDHVKKMLTFNNNNFIKGYENSIDIMTKFLTFLGERWMELWNHQKDNLNNFTTSVINYFNDFNDVITNSKYDTNFDYTWSGDYDGVHEYHASGKTGWQITALNAMLSVLMTPSIDYYWNSDLNFNIFKIGENDVEKQEGLKTYQSNQEFEIEHYGFEGEDERNLVSSYGGVLFYWDYNLIPTTPYSYQQVSQDFKNENSTLSQLNEFKHFEENYRLFIKSVNSFSELLKKTNVSEVMDEFNQWKDQQISIINDKTASFNDMINYEQNWYNHNVENNDYDVLDKINWYNFFVKNNREYNTNQMLKQIKSNFDVKVIELTNKYHLDKIVKIQEQTRLKIGELKYLVSEFKDLTNKYQKITDYNEWLNKNYSIEGWNYNYELIDRKINSKSLYDFYKNPLDIDLYNVKEETYNGVIVLDQMINDLKNIINEKKAFYEQEKLAKDNIETNIKIIEEKIKWFKSQTRESFWTDRLNWLIDDVFDNSSYDNFKRRYQLYLNQQISAIEFNEHTITKFGVSINLNDYKTKLVNKIDQWVVEYENLVAQETLIYNSFNSLKNFIDNDLYNEMVIKNNDLDIYNQVINKMINIKPLTNKDDVISYSLLKQSFDDHRQRETLIDYKDHPTQNINFDAIKLHEYLKNYYSQELEKYISKIKIENQNIDLTNIKYRQILELLKEYDHFDESEIDELNNLPLNNVKNHQINQTIKTVLDDYQNHLNNQKDWQRNPLNLGLDLNGLDIMSKTYDIVKEHYTKAQERYREKLKLVSQQKLLWIELNGLLEQMKNLDLDPNIINKLYQAHLTKNYNFNNHFNVAYQDLLNQYNKLGLNTNSNNFRLQMKWLTAPFNTNINIKKQFNMTNIDILQTLINNFKQDIKEAIVKKYQHLTNIEVNHFIKLLNLVKSKGRESVYTNNQNNIITTYLNQQISINKILAELHINWSQINDRLQVNSNEIFNKYTDLNKINMTNSVLMLNKVNDYLNNLIKKDLNDLYNENMNQLNQNISIQSVRNVIGWYDYEIDKYINGQKTPTNQTLYWYSVWSHWNKFKWTTSENKVSYMVDFVNDVNIANKHYNLYDVLLTSKVKLTAIINEVKGQMNDIKGLSNDIKNYYNQLKNQYSKYWNQHQNDEFFSFISSRKRTNVSFNVNEVINEILKNKTTEELWFNPTTDTNKNISTYTYNYHEYNGYLVIMKLKQWFNENINKAIIQKQHEQQVHEQEVINQLKNDVNYWYNQLQQTINEKLNNDYVITNGLKRWSKYKNQTYGDLINQFNNQWNNGNWSNNITKEQLQNYLDAFKYFNQEIINKYNNWLNDKDSMISVWKETKWYVNTINSIYYGLRDEVDTINSDINLSNVKNQDFYSYAFDQLSLEDGSLNYDESKLMRYYFNTKDDGGLYSIFAGDQNGLEKLKQLRDATFNILDYDGWNIFTKTKDYLNQIQDYNSWSTWHNQSKINLKGFYFQGNRFSWDTVQKSYDDANDKKWWFQHPIDNWAKLGYTYNYNDFEYQNDWGQGVGNKSYTTTLDYGNFNWGVILTESVKSYKKWKNVAYPKRVVDYASDIYTFVYGDGKLRNGTYLDGRIQYWQNLENETVDGMRWTTFKYWVRNNMGSTSSFDWNSDITDVNDLERKAKRWYEHINYWSNWYYRDNGRLSNYVYNSIDDEPIGVFSRSSEILTKDHHQDSDDLYKNNVKTYINNTIMNLNNGKVLKQSDLDLFDFVNELNHEVFAKSANYNQISLLLHQFLEKWNKKYQGQEFNTVSVNDQQVYPKQKINSKGKTTFISDLINPSNYISTLINIFNPPQNTDLNQDEKKQILDTMSNNVYSTWGWNNSYKYSSYFFQLADYDFKYLLNNDDQNWKPNQGVKNEPWNGYTMFIPYSSFWDSKWNNLVNHTEWYSWLQKKGVSSTQFYFTDNIYNQYLNNQKQGIRINLNEPIINWNQTVISVRENPKSLLQMKEFNTFFKNLYEWLQTQNVYDKNQIEIYDLVDDRLSSLNKDKKVSFGFSWRLIKNPKINTNIYQNLLNYETPKDLVKTIYFNHTAKNQNNLEKFEYKWKILNRNNLLNENYQNIKELLTFIFDKTFNDDEISRIYEMLVMKFSNEKINTMNIVDQHNDDNQLFSKMTFAWNLYDPNSDKFKALLKDHDQWSTNEIVDYVTNNLLNHYLSYENIMEMLYSYTNQIVSPYFNTNLSLDYEKLKAMNEKFKDQKETITLNFQEPQKMNYYLELIKNDPNHLYLPIRLEQVGIHDENNDDILKLSDEQYRKWLGNYFSSNYHDYYDYYKNNIHQPYPIYQLTYVKIPRNYLNQSTLTSFNFNYHSRLFGDINIEINNSKDLLNQNQQKIKKINDWNIIIGESRTNNTRISSINNDMVHYDYLYSPFVYTKDKSIRQRNINDWSFSLDPQLLTLPNTDHNEQLIYHNQHLVNHDIKFKVQLKPSEQFIHDFIRYGGANRNWYASLLIKDNDQNSQIMNQIIKYNQELNSSFNWYEYTWKEYNYQNDSVINTNVNINKQLINQNIDNIFTPTKFNQRLINKVQNPNQYNQAVSLLVQNFNSNVSIYNSIETRLYAILNNILTIKNNSQSISEVIFNASEKTPINYDFFNEEMNGYIKLLNTNNKTIVEQVLINQIKLISSLLDFLIKTNVLTYDNGICKFSDNETLFMINQRYKVYEYITKMMHDFVRYKQLYAYMIIYFEMNYRQYHIFSYTNEQGNVIKDKDELNKYIKKQLVEMIKNTLVNKKLIDTLKQNKKEEIDVNINDVLISYNWIDKFNYQQDTILFGLDGLVSLIIKLLKEQHINISKQELVNNLLILQHQQSGEQLSLRNQCFETIINLFAYHKYHLLIQDSAIYSNKIFYSPFTNLLWNTKNEIVIKDANLTKENQNDYLVHLNQSINQVSNDTLSKLHLFNLNKGLIKSIDQDDYIRQLQYDANWLHVNPMTYDQKIISDNTNITNKPWNEYINHEIEDQSRSLLQLYKMIAMITKLLLQNGADALLRTYMHDEKMYDIIKNSFMFYQKYKTDYNIELSFSSQVWKKDSITFKQQSDLVKEFILLFNKCDEIINSYDYALSTFNDDKVVNMLNNKDYKFNNDGEGSKINYQLFIKYYLSKNGSYDPMVMFKNDIINNGAKAIDKSISFDDHQLIINDELSLLKELYNDHSIIKLLTKLNQLDDETKWNEKPVWTTNSDFWGQSLHTYTFDYLKPVYEHHLGWDVNKIVSHTNEKIKELRNNINLMINDFNQHTKNNSLKIRTLDNQDFSDELINTKNENDNHLRRVLENYHHSDSNDWLSYTLSELKPNWFKHNWTRWGNLRVETTSNNWYENYLGYNVLNNKTVDESNPVVNIPWINSLTEQNNIKMIMRRIQSQSNGNYKQIGINSNGYTFSFNYNKQQGTRSLFNDHNRELLYKNNDQLIFDWKLSYKYDENSTNRTKQWGDSDQGAWEKALIAQFIMANYQGQDRENSEFNNVPLLKIAQNGYIHGTGHKFGNQTFRDTLFADDPLTNFNLVEKLVNVNEFNQYHGYDDSLSWDGSSYGNWNQKVNQKLKWLMNK